MKFNKQHQDLCEKHYGKSFLIHAMCDLHVNKHNSHIVRVMIGGDINDISDDTISTIWKSLTSWGRQMFSTSQQKINQINWTSVAANNEIPVFLMNMKQAAERLMNATMNTIHNVVKLIVKGSYHLWSYIQQLFFSSGLVLEKSWQFGQNQMLSVGNLFRKFGDAALKVFKWLGIHLVKIIKSLYNVIHEAVTNVSDVAASFIELFNGKNVFSSTKEIDIRDKNYDLMFTTLTFTRQVPYYKSQSDYVLSEYLKRYGSFFGRSISEIGNILRFLPDMDCLVPLLKYEYVSSLMKLVKIGGKMVAWIAARFKWLASFLRGVNFFAKYALSGFYQRMTVALYEPLDVLGAKFNQLNTNMPQTQMKEMIEFATSLSRNNNVDDMNKSRLKKVIATSNIYFNKMDSNTSTETQKNIHNGVKLSESLVLSKNSGHLMTQLLTGQYPDIELGNEITQFLFKKNVIDVIKESQTVYTLLFTEIWLSLQNVDDKKDEIDDEELARRMKKFIGGEIPDVDFDKIEGGDSWWSRIFRTKNTKDDSGLSEEGRNEISMREEIMLKRKHIALNRPFPVYDINPLSEAFDKRKMTLQNDLYKIRKQIDEEKQITGSTALILRAEASATYINKVRKLTQGDHRSGRTRIEKQGLKITKDFSELALNNLKHEYDNLKEQEEQILFELSILSKRQYDQTIRIQSRSVSWVWYIFGVTAILGIFYGGYLYRETSFEAAGKTLQAVKNDVVVGAKELIDFYHDQWLRNMQPQYLATPAPDIESLRQQGVLLINDLTNALSNNTIIKDIDVFVQYIQPYQLWLNHVASENVVPEIKNGANILLEGITSISIGQVVNNTEIGVPERINILKNVLLFLRANHELMVTGRMDGMLKSIVKGFGAGIGAVFAWTWRGATPTASDLSPTGIFSAAARGKNKVFLEACKKLTNAIVGIGAGFYGIALIGVWLVASIPIYMSEGAPMTTVSRLILAIPAILGPFIDMIYNKAIIAAEAVAYSQYSFWFTSISIGLMLLPGYGPFMLLKNVLTQLYQARRGTEPPVIKPAVDVIEKKRVTIQETPDEDEFMKKALKETKNDVKTVPSNEQERNNQIIIKALKETRELVPVEKTKKRFKKKRGFAPLTITPADVNMCVVCGDVAFLENTVNPTSRYYCDKQCISMDWDMKKENFKKFLLN